MTMLTQNFHWVFLQVIKSHKTIADAAFILYFPVIISVYTMSHIPQGQSVKHNRGSILYNADLCNVI